MFFSGFYMIQLNRMEPPFYEGKTPIFPAHDDSNGWVFGHGILRMWYLVLGDFGDVNLIRSYENFDDEEQIWIMLENFLSVVFFIGATMIT